MEHGCRKHVIWIRIFWNSPHSFPENNIHCLFNRMPKVWSSPGHLVAAVAGHKRSPHDSTVFVHNLRVTENVIHPYGDRFTRKGRQTWGEQKKRYIPIQIKSADF